MRTGRSALDLSAVAYGVAAAALISAGCSSPGASGVNAESAATRAMELYDADGDAALDAHELKKAPALAAAITAYDADGNGRLEANEIAKRLTRLFESSIDLAEVTVQVTADGQPLSGAVVRLRPAEFMGPGMIPAEGITDETGAAKPTIAEEHVPAEFRGTPLVQFGPYLVEVTHPERQLPARYNSESELGMDVDPTSRNGLSTSFALTTK